MINFMVLHKFKNLSGVKGVIHGIVPRTHNGYSMNMAFEFGNEAMVNRERLCEALGLKMLISARQTHSDHIMTVREGDAIPNIYGVDDEMADTDAFITNQPGIGLMVKTADCQPILMVGRGSAGPVVAMVHSGWRGSLKNIAGKTVQKMKADFGVDPASLIVGVGPSLGPCCAEFSDPENELTAEALTYRIKDSNRFDFWAMTRDQLSCEGVLADAMEFSNICTVCEKDKWFSFRADHPDVGRFGSVIGLVAGGRIMDVFF